MAEMCLDCWNQINGTNDPPGKYIMSKEPDLCEECGESKIYIIVERKSYYLRKYRKIIFPFRVLFFPAELVIRLIWGMCRLAGEKRQGEK